MSTSHRLSRMTGRDPRERHRAATPLELLFDLTFVIAFSQVSTQTASFLDAGEVGTALAGFAFTIFGATWAWINYSWLASAYDTDDVFFRLATFVQMVGVLVFALGIPPVFASIQAGAHLDNSVIVTGYVIMRVAAVALWLRAARHDPERRRTCLAYARNITIAQVFWVALIFVDLPLAPAFAIAFALILFELAGPIYAERRHPSTPWHAHHIAERYGLLVIIALGEVVLGTILTISAVVQESGWSLEAGLLALGGTALAFGLWWIYFVVPFGAVLDAHRGRGFLFGYLHYFVFAAIVGIGAGLHAAAQVISQEAEVPAVFAIWTVALSTLGFEVMLVVLYALLMRRLDPFFVWLLLGGAAVLALAVSAVALGTSLGVGILLAACSPALIVVGYETAGWRHARAMLERPLRAG